jgi:hypothetical protein
MKGTLIRAGILIATFLQPTASEAQTPTPRPSPFESDAMLRLCPTSLVSSPDSVNEGTSFFAAVNVSGGEKSVTPTYRWTISTGTILKGQGTTTIEVGTTGLGTQTITVTVDVRGYNPNCSTSASASAYVVKRPEARKFDEFGLLAKKDSNLRLDKFAIELMNDPGSQGYILGYGSRTSAVGTGRQTAEAAKTYLVDVRNVGNSLITVDGGYKEAVTIELWIVPAGATPPTASATVDRSRMKTSKPARKAPARRTRKSD